MLGVCPICQVEEIVDRLIVIRLTRISYLDMLLAVVTQYMMFFDCIKSRRSVSTSNIFLSYRLIIKYCDEYFISLSTDVVVT